MELGHPAIVEAAARARRGTRSVGRIALTSVADMTGRRADRLPARVYWVRRLMVLGIAMLLVVGIARLLGGSQRRVVRAGPGDAGRPTPAPGRPRRPRRSRRRPPRRRHGHQPARQHHVTDDTAPLADAVRAVRARRHRDHAVGAAPDRRPRHHAGPRPVHGDQPGLHLDALAPDARPQDHLGLRPDLDERRVRRRDPDRRTSCSGSAAPTRVTLTWNARRSEPGCPRTDRSGPCPAPTTCTSPRWPGSPRTLTFLLGAPTPAEVTRTAHPHQHQPEGLTRRDGTPTDRAQT